MRYINFLNENIDKHLEGNEVFNLTKKKLFVYRGATNVRHKIKTFELFDCDKYILFNVDYFKEKYLL